MPIPLVPVVIGAGIGALLLAGESERRAAPEVAPSAGPASPTTQSTGGPAGGAQAPSHADTGEAVQPGTPTQTAEIATSPTAPPGGASDALSSIASGFASGVTAISSGAQSTVQTGQEAAFTGDPWNPDPWRAESRVADNADLFKALGYTGGATTKVVGDTFASIGSSFGLVW